MRIDWRSPLFLALVPLLAFFAFLFSQKWIPTHDTLSAVIRAHYIFSGIAHHSELPFWSFNAWGMDNTFLFWQASLSPSLWALLPLGVFKNADFMHIYYLSLLLSELVLLTGAYLLSSRLYQSKWSILFVCLSITGSVYWAGQIFFNFHSYYALPLCFYFVTRGCQDKRVGDLLCSFLVLVICASLAATFYMSLLVGLIWLVFLGASAWTYGFGLADIRRKIRVEHKRALLLIFAVFGIFLLFFAGEKSWEVIAPNRSGSGAVGLPAFLTYADANELKLAPGFFDGLRNAFDFNAYAGFLMPALMIIGLVFRPGIAHLPLLIAGGFTFLFWLGSASFLAPLVYFLPGMKYFRHIGLVYPLLKLLLIFTAGFGMDQLVRWSHSTGRTPRNSNPAVWLVALLTVQAAVVVMHLGGFRYTAHGLRVLVVYGATLLFMASVWQNQATLKRIFGLVLCLLCALDIWSYRFSTYNEKLARIPSDTRRLFKLRATEFQPTRIDNFFDAKNFAELAPALYPEALKNGKRLDRETFAACMEAGPEECRLFDTQTLGVLYDYTEAFLGFDGCKSAFRADLATPEIAEGLRKSEFLRENCSGPKLAAASGAKIAIGEFSPNHIALTVNQAQAGPLHYLNAWHGNWEARVNGERATVEKFRDAFQSVVLPAGESRVELRYRTSRAWLVPAIWLICFAFMCFVFRLMWSSLCSAQKSEPRRRDPRA